jgi:hypothetical protein
VARLRTSAHTFTKLSGDTGEIGSATLNFTDWRAPQKSIPARHSDPGVSIRERASHCDVMNWKPSNAVPVFACLLVASAIAFAQAQGRPSDAQQSNTQKANARQAPQMVYTTLPKTSVAKLTSILQSGGPAFHEIRGKATFTLTAANTDDTLTGTLIFTIPNEARQKIAQASGKPLNSIPASVAQKDVIAGFRRGAACPVVNLIIGATELEVAGVKLSFKRIVVDVIETPAEVPQHICAWTRQINTGRPHRGVIASLNRLIAIEPD